MNAATTAATKSATGMLAHTPIVPYNGGNTYRHGIKNNNCRVSERYIAFRAMPNA